MEEEEEELRRAEGEEARTLNLDASVLLLLLLKQPYRGPASRLHVYTLGRVLLGPVQGPAQLALPSEAIYP